MRIFVFGSSLTSSYWNGAATYYRGIYKNLHRLGHSITFAEPDIYKRQQNQDSEEIDYAAVLVYQTPRDLNRMLAEASNADLIIKHSGVGADDEWLETKVLCCRSARTKVAFWDVDAPATLARVQQNPSDSFRELIPRYDFIFTYGGGLPVVQQYRGLGAKNCFPIYNGLDPDTHYPVSPDRNFVCDLAFVGHRLPDRENRVDEFFFAAAELAPELSFVLGGEGWSSRTLPRSVRWIGHVSSTNHNRINCSARMVLNINRQSMAEVGFSPPTRVFEAAGAGACVITDAWAGIDHFFTPKKEILVASSAHDVVRYLREISTPQGQKIGAAMRTRALRDHTYNLRALEFQAAMQAIDEITSETASLTHSHV
ncbi:MAG TPA: glycosyltransferase [Terriglobales bacterium]|nr:glycosyltransferase [Terriglobales bacterium]